MPSWNDGEESTEEEFVGMDMELCENPHTRVDASFYDKASDPSIKCTLRLAPCLKYVAFEGIHTRRSQLVEDVTKLFDWRDAEEQNKQFQNDEDPQKKEMDVYKHMQKLAIDKEKEKLENDKMKE
ncbi:hypothetical protein ZWY2020_048392 [Hordeum vulgare]|nr:hypothetical protein ZWY2020_048392 [Hordeum vulgare]